MAKTDVDILTALMRHIKAEDDDPLTPMIDAYYLEREQALHRLTSYTVPMVPPPRPGGRLSPSGIGGCQRLAVFRFTGFRGSRKVDPEQEMVFDQGNWIHHKWGATFKDMELVLGKDRFKVLGIEKKVRIPGLYVSGRYDALVMINGKVYLVDFKSIRGRGFQFILNQAAPAEAHIKQVIAYLVARGKKRGLIFYENKDDQQIMVFKVVITDELWEEVESWIQRVLNYLEREELPGKSPLCSKGTMLWEKCPYSKFCWGDKYKNEPALLRAKVFKNFVGLDEAWKRGLSEEEAA